jgi:hypothetical protein
VTFRQNKIKLIKEKNKNLAHTFILSRDKKGRRLLGHVRPARLYVTARAGSREPARAVSSWGKAKK